MPSRRRFLHAAASVTAGVAAPLAAGAATPAGPRWSMVVDLSRCVGCQACTVACSLEHAVPADRYRTTVQVHEVRVDGVAKLAMLPRLCNHCDQPACVPVCPEDATFRMPDGTVQIDDDKCIGCGKCVRACPYRARFLNPDSDTVEKCSLCVHRLDAGLLPACVETCVGGARQVGDRNDPAGVVAAAIARGARVLMPEKDTRPAVYYLGLETLPDLPAPSAAPAKTAGSNPARA